MCGSLLSYIRPTYTTKETHIYDSLTLCVSIFPRKRALCELITRHIWIKKKNESHKTLVGFIILFNWNICISFDFILVSFGGSLLAYIWASFDVCLGLFWRIYGSLWTYIWVFLIHICGSLLTYMRVSFDVYIGLMVSWGLHHSHLFIYLVSFDIQCVFGSLLTYIWASQIFIIYMCYFYIGLFCRMYGSLLIWQGLCSEGSHLSF